jgi:hypothetical protein
MLSQMTNPAVCAELVEAPSFPLIFVNNEEQPFDRLGANGSLYRD